MALLLREADIDAGAIYEALDRQAEANHPTILRRNHPYVETIAEVTKIDIVSISRRHRHLLLDIEQRAGKNLSWTYQEHSRNRCKFACRSLIGETAKLALNKAPLSSLVDAPRLLSSLTIESVGDSFDGWTSALLDPGWRLF